MSEDETPAAAAAADGDGTSGDALARRLDDVAVDDRLAPAGLERGDDSSLGVVVGEAGVVGASTPGDEAASTEAGGVAGGDTNTNTTGAEGGDPKARAINLIDDDRMLEAARVVRASGVHVVSRPDAPNDDDAKLHRFMGKAAMMQDLLDSLKSTPGEGSGWTVQGEHMGRRDVSIYYRTDPETGTKLTARIESPISTAMLVPLLSVLNESELYATWQDSVGPHSTPAIPAMPPVEITVFPHRTDGSTLYVHSATLGAGLLYNYISKYDRDESEIKKGPVLHQYTRDDI